jgi:diguanylate cyclase (GGDEF)-like protein
VTRRQSLGTDESPEPDEPIKQRMDLSWLIDLINGSPGLDARARAGRLASTFFVAAGLLIGATVWFLPDGILRRPLLGVACFSIAIGPVLALLPWRHLAHVWTLVPAVIGLTLVTLAGAVVPNAIDIYVPMYLIPFVYVGLTQRPGRALILAPLAAGSFGLIAFGAPEWTDATTHEFAIVLPLAVVIGELLAQRTLRHEQAETNIERLLDAVIELGEVETEEETADLVAALTNSLIGADSTVVMVAEDMRSSRFANKGQRGLDVQSGQIKIDIATEPSGLGVAIKARQTVFVPDAESSPLVGPKIQQLAEARSMVFMPLPGEGGYLGGIVSSWRRRHRRLDHYAQRAVELLSEEAGRTLERVRQSRKLRHEAETDALTGLYNRRTLSRFLEAMNHGDAVVLIDLDHFKKVNDELGHAAGDDTLSLFATAMKQVVRDEDCVARYGGEEFVLVLKNAGERGATSMLKRLSALWTEFAPPTTYSAGVAVYEPGDSPAIVLARADAALYRAKTNGRDRVEVSSAGGSVEPGATWIEPTTGEHSRVEI